MRLVPYSVRPLGPWLGPRTAEPRRSPFGRVTWQSTLELISHELRMMGAARWVLQIEVPERYIRNDGQLHARAVPGSPAVRVSFECGRGPLQFATDRFDHWQINVRAVATAMQDLRRVERYGVANSGEQYRGFTAIAQRGYEMTVEQAAEFLAHWAEPDDADKRETATRALRRSPDLFLSQIYKRAARRVHPDLGGDDDTMARLNAARDLIERARGGGQR